MKQSLRLWALLVFLAAHMAVCAAQDLPRIEFTLEYPQQQPAVTSILISQGGAGIYRYLPPEGSEQEPVEQALRLREGAVKKIFELAAAADNFSGDFEFKHKVAFSGRKTLTYVSAEGKRRSASFNHSQHRAMVDLDHEFRGMIETLEAERELSHLARFDKLGLNAALGRMEGRAKSGWMRHLSLIQPVLKKLANDRSIMHLARSRAGRLLAEAEKEK